MISELNEDDDGIVGGDNGHSLEELDKKFKKWELTKGMGRTSLMIGFERHSLNKGPPKKAVNRASYRFVEVLLNPDTKPEVFLAYYKELNDRLDGKASQAVQVTGNLAITHEQALGALK